MDLLIFVKYLKVKTTIQRWMNEKKRLPETSSIRKADVVKCISIIFGFNLKSTTVAAKWLHHQIMCNHEFYIFMMMCCYSLLIDSVSLLFSQMFGSDQVAKNLCQRSCVCCYSLDIFYLYQKRWYFDFVFSHS